MCGRPRNTYVAEIICSINGLEWPNDLAKLQVVRLAVSLLPTPSLYATFSPFVGSFQSCDVETRLMVSNQKGYHIHP